MSLTNSNKFRKVVELEIKTLKNQKTKVGESAVKVTNNAIKTQNWVQTQKSNSFDVDSELRGKYRIKSAGNHFYEIGLTFYQFGDEKRTWFHNPYFKLKF